MTPAGPGAGAVPARGVVSLAPGRLRDQTPGRHYDRPADSSAVLKEGRGRVTPVRARAPSQEERELELSGGVRSLPQVPRWNAGRRAPSVCSRKPGVFGGGAAPVWRGSLNTRLPAFRFPFFLRSPALSDSSAEASRKRRRKRNPGAAFKPAMMSPAFASLKPGYRFLPDQIEPVRRLHQRHSGVTRS